MSRKPGKYVQIIAGAHTGKQGLAYNRDQLPEIIKAGKVAVWIPEIIQSGLFPDAEVGKWRKVLFDPAKLKLIGFFD